MFHGYSDVVAYRRTSVSSCYDDEYLQSSISRKSQESSSVLPFELEISYPTPDPWPSDSNIISSDFVLIAEFCEIKGPKPLISIPSQFTCSLDLNSFAVRILSVDYQGVESGSCISAEDTQAFLPDVYPGVHAYVHYTTLSDISARGFVRPMCLAYVSTEKLKLIHNFKSIRAQFSTASSHLKYGSRIQFKNELELRLQDLLFTKGCYITHSTQSPKTETVPSLTCDKANLLKSITLESLQSSIEEIERALIRVRQLINDEGIHKEDLTSLQEILNNAPQKFAKYQDAENLTTESHQPSLVNPSIDCFDGSLRNIFELSKNHAAICLYYLFKTFMHYSSNDIELQLKMYHTVLPHMEQVPYSVVPSSNNLSENFWESFRCYDMKELVETLSECQLDSSISSDLSSSDSISFNQSFDCTSVSFSSSLEFLNSNLFQTIQTLNENSPGFGISKVFRNFPCGHHILYSLLMSRLIVIVGSTHSESIVRDVVQALKPLIVPFTCPALVIPWRCETLKVTDLGWLQLVGLCHSPNQCLNSIIPDSMKHYISILDVDKHIFVGPAYSGKFLRVFNKDFKCCNDVTLLSSINSMIFDIILKTRIYYYHQLEAESSIQADRSHSMNEDNDKLFFRQMTNSASDISIIKHLVEVMKMETINKLNSRNNHAKKFDGLSSAPVVRIRHEPVSILKL